MEVDVEVLKNYVAATAWLREEHGIVLGPGKVLYRYDGGIYVPDGEEQVGKHLLEAFGPDLPVRLRGNVLSLFRSVPVDIDPQPEPGLINCANGLLDWRTGDLIDHGPWHVSLSQVPWEWHRGAKCPRIDAFLEEVAPEGGVKLLKEVLGYALLADRSFQKMVMLLGPAGTGKSQFLHLLRALVGVDNTCAIKLQALGEHRFALAQLQGKLVNIYGDLDPRTVKSTDDIKAITGGDPITAEHKGGQMFQFIPYALNVFSSNAPPRTSDQSDAWFDRWIVVPFEHRFRGTAGEVRGLGVQLAEDKSEMEGLFVESVRALWEVMQRGSFSNPQARIDAERKYRLSLDSVRGFIDEECQVGPEVEVHRKRFYAVYTAWCNEGKRPPLGRGTFNDRVRELPGIGERHDRALGDFWTGLTLKLSPQAEV